MLPNLPAHARVPRPLNPDNLAGTLALEVNDNKHLCDLCPGAGAVEVHFELAVGVGALRVDEPRV